MFEKEDIKIEVNEKDFIHYEKVNSLDPRQVVYKHKEYRRQNRIDQYFSLCSIICLLIMTLYAYLIITSVEVPEYITFFVGSILAYYLLKQPTEVK